MATTDLGIWKPGPNPSVEPITPIGERFQKLADSTEAAILAVSDTEPPHKDGRRWFKHGVVRTSVGGTWWADSQFTLKDNTGFDTNAAQAMPWGMVPLLQAFPVVGELGGASHIYANFPRQFASPPMVFLTGIEGTPVAPVVGSNNVETTRVLVVFSGVPANTRVRFHVMAVGWV